MGFAHDIWNAVFQRLSPVETTNTGYLRTGLTDANGTQLLLDKNGNVPLTYGASPALDKFGRARVSNPQTLFDSKNIFNDPGLATSVENQPLFYDNQEVSGGGTSTTYNDKQASQTLTVSSGTAGKRVRQTKMRFNYQPGKSQEILMTFNLNGGTPSICLRTNTSGTPVDNEIAQEDWNLDKMDGTGFSGITLDFTKTQILLIDFEWLGVGTVGVGFVVDGIIYYAHAFHNSNINTVVYMSTPNLPLRSEIASDGVGGYTKREGYFDDNNGIFLKLTGGTNSITQICSSVVSEGGSEDLGMIRYKSTEGTHIDANVENTLYAVIGMKLKPEYIGASIKLLNASVQLQTASSKVEWVLLFNPTVAGTFTYSNRPQSAIQVATGATANTVTGGYQIGGGFAESGGQQSGNAGSDSKGLDNALLLGSKIDGTLDSIVLCVRPIGGSTNVDAEASLTWREIV